MKNGIVIPCCNEESRINLSEFEKFIDSNPSQVICFVNNGSQDNTLSVLKNFQRRLLNSHNSLATQVLIYDMPTKEDRGQAIKAGINHLVENTMVKNIAVAEGLLTSVLGTHKFINKRTQLGVTMNAA